MSVIFFDFFSLKKNSDRYHDDSGTGWNYGYTKQENLSEIGSVFLRYRVSQFKKCSF